MPCSRLDLRPERLGLDGRLRAALRVRAGQRLRQPGEQDHQDDPALPRRGGAAGRGRREAGARLRRPGRARRRAGRPRRADARPGGDLAARAPAQPLRRRAGAVEAGQGGGPRSRPRPDARDPGRRPARDHRAAVPVDPRAWRAAHGRAGRRRRAVRRVARAGDRRRAAGRVGAGAGQRPRPAVPQAAADAGRVIASPAHLDSCAQDDAELVAAATRVGVTRILTIGQDGATGRAALAAAEAFPHVFAAIGHHPNQATGFDDGHLAELQALAAHDRCRAIGETGLEFFRDYAPRADQERAFHAQIELAKNPNKPLVIHTRAAEDDTIATLRTRAQGVKVILHCFSMPDRLDECLAEGWFISFAGNVTYPKNEDLAAAVEHVPDDRILVETDAPYLTPQPLRKHRNQPAYVTETAQFVAERRGQGYAELEAILERNAAELLKW